MNFLIKEKLIDISIFIHKITIHEFFLVFCVLVFITLILEKKYNYLKIFTTSAILTTSLVLLIKNITMISRPENAIIKLDDFAFPSGHSAMSFALIILFSYFILNENKNKKLNYFFIFILVICAIFISSTRLILNVHTITQSIAGALIGIIISILSIKIFSKKNRIK